MILVVGLNPNNYLSTLNIEPSKYTQFTKSPLNIFIIFSKNPNAAFTKLELEWVGIGMGKNENELEWE